MTQAEGLADWLRLMLTDGIGPQTARELLTHFGLPEHIFAAGFSALHKCVHEKLALTLCSAPSDHIRTQIDVTLAWVEQAGNHILTFADTGYPSMLLTITDPPPVLYVKGRAELLTKKSIAIVGSRNATVQGSLSRCPLSSSSSSCACTSAMLNPVRVTNSSALTGSCPAASITRFTDDVSLAFISVFDGGSL